MPTPPRRIDRPPLRTRPLPPPNPSFLEASKRRHKRNVAGWPARVSSPPKCYRWSAHVPLAGRSNDAPDDVILGEFIGAGPPVGHHRRRTIGANSVPVASQCTPFVVRDRVIEPEAMAELMDQHSQIVRCRGREIGRRGASETATSHSVITHDPAAVTSRPEARPNSARPAPGGRSESWGLTLMVLRPSNAEIRHRASSGELPTDVRCSRRLSQTPSASAIRSTTS